MQPWAIVGFLDRINWFRLLLYDLESNQYEDNALVMKYQAPKDKRERRAFAQEEFRRLCFKAMIRDRTLHAPLHGLLTLRFQSLGRNGSLVRLRNRCIRSGKARAIYRSFGLDRFEFKRLANLGRLTGVEKTGW
jgi:small subunit ribosomal protein S14